MRYYLGLDNGGTTTKAALFDIKGNEIGVYSVSTKVITPRPGFVERDMEEMWQANCQVIAGVLKKCAISPDEIAGIGICGHGKGLYLWGKDGCPARNGIMSTDNRAYDYVDRWWAEGTEDAVFELSCQHIMSCQPVALLAWIRDHEPSVYENIAWVFECKDYIRFRLTGQAKAEITDYSGANLLNLHTRNYDDKLLRLFGLEGLRTALPPLCRSDEICGYVSEASAAQCGLVPGIPVIGGMFDIDACAIATGVMDTDSLCVIAGTWSINEYICHQPVTDGSVLMNSFFCLPEYYLIEESSPTSAGNNEWFLNQLFPELDRADAAQKQVVYEEINRSVAETPAEEFVPVFLPFLLGSNMHPNAKGAFVGLSVNHTRRHLLRAVYEGVAFSHKYHVDKLNISRNVPFCRVRLAGGVAHSAVWTQIFADVLEMPIETVDADETGALGCAIAVAAAVGDYGSIEEAAKAMCRVSPAVVPDPGRSELYRQKYAMYLKTAESLDGLWDSMQSFIEGRA